MSEKQKDLHEIARLVPAGMNTDGEMEWIGTDNHWMEYDRLCTLQGSDECACRKCGETVICVHEKGEYHQFSLCGNCV